MVRDQLLRLPAERAPGSFWLRTCGLLAGAALLCGSSARAVDAADVAPSERASDDWAVHGQFTFTEQEAGTFPAPYRGANSLTPGRGHETTDATLYLGRRLWRNAELWINPELDQGFGLDNTLGVAGFPSGEAYKIGKNQPYFRLQRFFVRSNVNLAGPTADVDATANQFAGIHSESRWVFTLGKMSVGDIFDVNQYAHDPRNDFLNWSVIDGGAFDYAADAWGYSVGAAAEWYHGDWAARAGVYDLSTVPNSVHLQPGLHQVQWLIEAEHRYEIAGLAGKAAITGFESRGRMALLDDALAHAQATNGPIDLAAVRRYRARTGVSANLEQSIYSDLGAFARASSAGGTVEAYEFTDIDRSLAAGLSLKGRQWHRAQDTIGIAAVDNVISRTRQRYLDAGGLGILVGDGRLPHPAPERLIETYYSWHYSSTLQLTLDYQRVKNPAYNADRGPAPIYAVRVHASF